VDGLDLSSFCGQHTIRLRDTRGNCAWLMRPQYIGSFCATGHVTRSRQPYEADLIMPFIFSSSATKGFFCHGIVSLDKNADTPRNDETSGADFRRNVHTRQFTWSSSPRCMQGVSHSACNGPIGRSAPKPRFKTLSLHRYVERLQSSVIELDSPQLWVSIARRITVFASPISTLTSSK
jgi:hypothetical protein